MTTYEHGMTPSGTLLVVSTPIGNADDITLRAIKALQAADVIVCEEEKEGRRLLRSLDVTAPVQTLNEHSNASDVEAIIGLLKDGNVVALISDAGTPLLADPGQGLVRRCIEAGVQIDVVPGASSVLTALVRSGLDASSFVFAGFVRRDDEGRREDLKRLAREPRTVILLEAPYRLRQLLTSMAAVLPDRRCYVGCNLTMPSESHHYGTVADLAAYFTEKTFKGEFVVCFAGADPSPPHGSPNTMQNNNKGRRSDGGRRPSGAQQKGGSGRGGQRKGGRFKDESAEQQPESFDSPTLQPSAPARSPFDPDFDPYATSEGERHENTDNSVDAPRGGQQRPRRGERQQQFQNPDQQPREGERRAPYSSGGRQQSSRQARPDSRPNDRPDQRRNDRPDQRRGDRPDQRRNDRPDQRRNDRPDQRRYDRPDQRRTDRPDQRRSDRPDDRRFDRPDQRRNDRPDFRRNDRPDQRRNDRPDQRRNDRPDFRRNDRPDQRQVGRSDQRRNDRPERPNQQQEFRWHDRPDSRRPSHQDERPARQGSGGTRQGRDDRNRGQHSRSSQGSNAHHGQRRNDRSGRFRGNEGRGYGHANGNGQRRHVRRGDDDEPNFNRADANVSAFDLLRGRASRGKGRQGAYGGRGRGKANGRVGLVTKKRAEKLGRSKVYTSSMFLYKENLVETKPAERKLRSRRKKPDSSKD